MISAELTIGGGLSVGDLATWVGAAVTSGALWVAILGLRNERRHRIAAEGAATDRAHRSQAEAVFAWYAGFTPGAEPSPGGGYDSLIVRNDSNLPVYGAVVSLVQGAGARTSEQVAEHPNLRYTLRKETFLIPPGTWRFRVAEGWRGMSARAGAEVAFRDAGGNSWVRRADGALEGLPTGPFEHLDVSRPINDYELEPIEQLVVVPISSPGEAPRAHWRVPTREVFFARELPSRSKGASSTTTRTRPHRPADEGRTWLGGIQFGKSEVLLFAPELGIQATWPLFSYAH